MNSQVSRRPNVIASLPSPPSQIPGLDMSYRDTDSYRYSPSAQPPKAKGSSFLSKLGKGFGSFLGGVGNSLLGGIPGAIGGIFSSIFGNKQAKENRRFQAEQAQIQRDFNHAEAELARQFSEKMWLMNNEWNLPVNQMRRLSEAGINPAMYYSSGTGLQNAAPVESSPQAYSNASPSGSTSDFSGISHAGDAFNIARLNAAQSSKLEQEAKGVEIDNLTRDIANHSIISLRNSSEQLNFGRLNVSQEEARSFAKGIEIMDANLGKIGSEIYNNMAQGRLLNINALFKEATFRDVCRQVSLETGMKEQDAEIHMKSLILDLGIKSATALMDNAIASRNYSEASSLKEYTENLKVLRDGYVFDNGNKAFNLFENAFTFDSRVYKTNKVNYAEGDTATAQKYINVVGSGLGTLAATALPFLGITKFGKAFIPIKSRSNIGFTK